MFSTVLTVLIACGTSEPMPAVEANDEPAAPEPATEPAEPPKPLMARLSSVEDGSALTGTVKLAPAGERVQVEIDLSGGGAGLHAVHVHEAADCSAVTDGSAGSLVDFSGLPGGTVPPEPDPEVSAALDGNLGEVDMGEEGDATTKHPVPLLGAEQLSALSGKSVLVHRRGNDPSEPHGDAGAAVACGILKVDPGS